MRFGILATTLLALYGLFAQIADPLAGVWKNEEIRLTLAAGDAAGVYSGSLEFAGKIFPVSSRSTAAGSSISGIFISDGNRFEFSARLEAGKLKFTTEGTEYLLTREGTGNPLAVKQAPVTYPPVAPIPGAALSAGAVRHRHASGLSLTPPAGWKVQDGPQGVILLPPGVTFNPQQIDELYIAASQPGSATDPKVAEELQQGLGQHGGRLNRSSVQLGGRQAILYSGEMRNAEQNLMIGVRIYMLQDGPNVNSVIGIAAVDRVTRNDAALRQVAATMSFQAPPQTASLPAAGGLSDGSAIANQWVQKLRGQKLQQLTTGNYDAGRSIWSLNAAGTFTSSSSYSGAVYAPGGGNASVGRTSGGEGRWRIVSRGGTAILELRFTNGEQREYELTANGTQTFMNGRRTYVTDPSEGN